VDQFTYLGSRESNEGDMNFVLRLLALYMSKNLSFQLDEILGPYYESIAPKPKNSNGSPHHLSQKYSGWLEKRSEHTKTW
jgi:hypothetical protein